MNSASQHITLPLDTLVERLNLAGYEISPRQRIQMWRILNEYGRDDLNNISALKYRLAPLIVTNASEQQQFYQIFDKYISDIQSYQPEEKETPLQWWEKIPVWLWGTLLTLGLIVLLGSLLLLVKYPSDPVLQLKHDRIVNLNAPFVVENYSTGYDSISTRFLWELGDVTTNKIEQQHEHPDGWRLTISELGDSPDKFIRLIASVEGKNDTMESPIHLHCANPPTYKAIHIVDHVDSTQTMSFSLDTTAQVEQDMSYEWDFGDGNKAEGYEVTHSYQEAGAYEVNVNISRISDSGYCSQKLNKRISIGEKEYAFLTFKRLVADQPEKITHFGLAIWLILVLIALRALYSWYRWLNQKPDNQTKEKQEQALQARFKYADQGPYQIPFQPQDDVLRPGTGLYRLAQILRLRQEGIRRVLDVPATIHHTIEQGGFPAVHMKHTSLPPNYLFLIDEQGPHSHQAALYRYLIDFLKGQDVHIVAFWYRKTPEHCWNEQYTKGLKLEQIQQLYPYYRLLILGDGQVMLDPHAREKHQVKPKIASLIQRWNSRLLLTPLPAVDWTYKEGVLYDLLSIFPSDSTGIDAAMAFLETDQDEEDQRARPGFVQWQSERNQSAPAPATNYRNWNRLSTYESYFEHHPKLFRWFRALMVYPSPSWSLTLAIGQGIGAPVNFDNLLLLTRIPFLKGKPIPNKVRTPLLEGLDKSTAAQARRIVANELVFAAPAVKNSHANRKLQTQLAMQQFIIDPEAPEHKNAIRHLVGANVLNKRELAELGDGLKKHQGKETALEEHLSGKSKAPALFPRRRNLNSDFYLALAYSLGLFVLCVLIGLMDGSQQLNSMLSGFRKDHPLRGVLVDEDIVSDSALIYHNQAVASWDSLKKKKAILQPSDLKKIEQQFQLALDYRAGEYPLAAANKARNDYHLGLLYYHQFLQSKDAAELNQSKSRQYFERARESNVMQLDALHGLGLLTYYQEDIPEATTYYNGLAAQYYFDTLQLQPNLRSLLFRMEGQTPQSNCIEPPVFELLSSDTLCPGDTLRLMVFRTKAKIDYYIIRWGDGTADTLEQGGEASHIYQFISGKVPLSVLGFGECNREGKAYNLDTKGIVLNNSPESPEGFGMSTKRGCPPLNVDLNFGAAISTYDSIEWDFGNGITSREETPNVVYKRPGTYTISLRLLNDCGEAVVAQQLEVLSEAECRNTFSVNGIVVDSENDEPIPYAMIQAGDANRTTDTQLKRNQGAFSAFTDKNGRFEIKGIPGGTSQLQVRISLEGYEDRFMRYRPGKEPLLGKLKPIIRPVADPLDDTRQTGCIDGDCINGQGRYTYADGSRYEGSFKNGEPDGLGLLFYADGIRDRYEGNFSEGLPNGKGALLYKNGTEELGSWEAGKYIGNQDTSINIKPIEGKDLKKDKIPVINAPDDYIPTGYAIQLATQYDADIGKYLGLADLGDVYAKRDGKSYSVLLGVFNSEREAKSVLKNVIKRGYRDAVVVEEKGGKNEGKK